MEKSKQGKKNRQAGQRFELKVRKDLESNSWFVARWSDNVEFIDIGVKDKPKIKPLRVGKLIPAKSNRYALRTTGFPDFIAFMRVPCWSCYAHGFGKCGYNNMGVECKGGDDKHKYLTKEEKEKCEWLLKNDVFSRILIASKGKKKGEIIYKEFQEKNKSTSTIQQKKLKE